MSIKRIPTKDLTTIPPIRDAFFEYTRSYDNWGSDYSVTGLIRPPREIMLANRYREELDALPFTHDMIENAKKSFRGTAIHNHLEYMIRRYMQKNPNKGYVFERRVWDRICGRKISGKFDIFLNGALYDYKTTSVWKAIFGNWEDYIQQLNLYDYLLGTCGKKVTVLYLIAWYMDWDKDKTWKDPDYPKNDIELIHVTEKWPTKQQKEFLEGRIELMKSNEEKADNELDYCTSDEMWEKPTVYAVMRPGQKRAVAAKGLTSRKKAGEYIKKSMAKDKDTFEIEVRTGTRTKCDDYCKVAPWCNQYQEYTKKKEAGNGN
jgi:hypothetical protein